jgi:hypothetical protein
MKPLAPVTYTFGSSVLCKIFSFIAHPFLMPPNPALKRDVPAMKLPARPLALR